MKRLLTILLALVLSLAVYACFRTAKGGETPAFYEDAAFVMEPRENE